MSFNKGMVRVGAGLPGLLKDGYQHLSGIDEAVMKNIEATKQLSAITRTSLGPNGMNKLVINHLEKLFVTSDAATICQELEVIHPAAMLVVMACKMQETECGDATNFIVTFVGELLAQAESLLRTGLHISEIVTGYQKAYKKSLTVLEGLATNKCNDIRDKAELTRVLKSVIGAKQYGNQDFLAPLIAEAGLIVTPPAGAKRSFNLDNVRVAKLVGSNLRDSIVVKGMVVQRPAQGSILKMENAKVAVFAQAVSAAETEAKGTVLIKSADELLNYNKGEEKMMDDAIKEIADAGVNVILSGGSVSQMAMHFIEKHKILCIKITSKWMLRRLCRTVQATALPKLGAPTPEEMGRCSVVEQVEIGSEKVTIFRQEDATSKVATVVLRGSTKNILNDLERAVDDGVNTMKTLAKDPRLVPGAGASEIEIAHQLRGYAKECPGLDQYAVAKFGEALEVVPRTLSENSGQKATEVVSQLYAAHAAGKTAAGVNVDGEGLVDAEAAEIFDLYLTKRSAIDLAVEAALTVLRVDQIIMSKRAGGPKPKGPNPNWDDTD